MLDFPKKNYAYYDILYNMKEILARKNFINKNNYILKLLK